MRVRSGDLIISHLILITTIAIASGHFENHCPGRIAFRLFIADPFSARFIVPLRVYVLVGSARSATVRNRRPLTGSTNRLLLIRNGGRKRR